MLKQRVLTAIPLAALVLVTIIWLDQRFLLALLALVLWQSGWELTRMLGIQSGFKRYAYSAALLLISVALLKIQDIAVFPWLIWLAVALWLGLSAFVLGIRQIAPLSAGWKKIHLVLGLSLIPLAAISLLQLRQQYMHGEWLLMYVFSLIWVADSAAYFTGKWLGKHKLAPVVSPGKSFEGAIGGLLAVLLWALGVYFYGYHWQLSLVTFLLLSVFSAMISIMGDLYESLVKRQSGFKDSGKLLPGHGGVLDRVDSLLAAAPVFLAGLLVYGVQM